MKEYKFGGELAMTRPQDQPQQFRRMLYRFVPEGLGALAGYLDVLIPQPRPRVVPAHHAAAIAGPDEQ